MKREASASDHGDVSTQRCRSDSSRRNLNRCKLWKKHMTLTNFRQRIELQRIREFGEGFEIWDNDELYSEDT